MLIFCCWLMCKVVFIVFCILEVVCMVWSIFDEFVVVDWVNVCILVCDIVKWVIVVKWVDDGGVVWLLVWDIFDWYVVVDWVVSFLLVWDIGNRFVVFDWVVSCL